MSSNHYCKQHNYKETQKGNLLAHIKSSHEAVNFPCKQGDYKATQKGNSLEHIAN